MTRIGLLGGTFDPVHLGHLVVAEAVREQLQLDQVRLLVAGDPWMKRCEADAADRVALCELSVADHPDLVVDARETRRDGPTYTADTLAELREAEPDATWAFVLGADAALRLPDWHRVDEAIGLADWAVVARPGSTWPDHHLADRLTRVDVPPIGISSTDVRARLRAGRSIRYLVPDPVRLEIHRRGLYRERA